MLKFVMPTNMVLPSPCLTRLKKLWSTTLLYSLLIAFLAQSWLKLPTQTRSLLLWRYIATEPYSTPVLFVSCWLLPLIMMATQNHMPSLAVTRQRTYMLLFTRMDAFLMLAFSATQLIMFHVMCEASLMPTLLIITRCGNESVGLHAGTYLSFYTLARSLPVFIALLPVQNSWGTLYQLTLQLTMPSTITPYAEYLWWSRWLLAFLVNTRLYGPHLWLPKALVEGPIAGSIMHAAVFVKLGGYGMMRIMPVLEPLTKELSLLFIILAHRGVVMTRSTSLRHTEHKSLMVYSTVRHLWLVAAALLIQTPWSFTGALNLMIGHGLTSSALYCLATTNYDPSHSRKLFLERRLQMVVPIMTSWWFLASLANLAVASLAQLMGDFMIVSFVLLWSPWTLSVTGSGSMITAGYSQLMLSMTQRGPLPAHIIRFNPTYTLEQLQIFPAMPPLWLLILKPHLIWGWPS
uniref:NADH-ubiquinone oxidoreductase chain 4 n=1 Tax=Tylosurus melanotus TaxID=3053213 RepID=A0A167NFC5_9TELE|nr:NADH dehydrogenase subunit 4 [Tylosurus acus melanotus]